MFVATKVLTWLASPFGVFICGTVLGACVLIFARGLRAKIFARALVALAIAQVALFASFPIADAVMGPLEAHAREMAARAPKDGYAAILLLGGAMSSPPEGSNELPVFRSAFARIVFAAQLQQAGVAPRIIATGGRFEGKDGRLRSSEAAGMRDMLVALGVPRDAILLEEQSRNTRENAIESAKLLPPGARVALVTSASHMSRALREMQLAGLEAHAFPTDFLVRPDEQNAWDVLPNPEALDQSSRAIKEWLGRLVVWLRAWAA